MLQDNSPDMKYYIAPGVIELTPAAFALARAFADHIKHIGSGDWIVNFSWGSARSITDERRGTTVDLGPGLDIGAKKPDKVPVAAICERDGLKYAFQIPSEIVAKAPRKIVDVVSPSGSAVRLL